MPTGLIRRAGGMYSTRRRIPLALVPFYRGKAEEVRALGTNQPAEARRRHALMWVKLDQEFEAARQAMAEATVAPSPEQPIKTPEQLAEWHRERDQYEADYHEWQSEDLWDAEFNPDRKRRTAERQALREEWEAEKAAERAAVKAEAAAEKRAKGHITLTAVVDKWAAEQKPKPRTVVRTRNIVD